MARILVIEDEDPMRRMIRQMLERDGHEVVEARDGAEGIRRFGEQPTDLVVVDIYLPGKNGWETIRGLDEIAPGVPFILVSSSAPLEGLKPGARGTLDSRRRPGEFRILRKPFEWRALSDAVGELVGVGRAPRAEVGR